MIYKVTYQESKKEVPRREATHALYIDAESPIQVRELITAHTPYNIEYIQELDEAHLAYEQKNPDFELTEFDA
ncbi:DNA-directed RNA polymerase subunit epsilon [Aerococcus kribbianus]|uniref:DNA-directed RNA polymerase subunit epsilon n=1 Tax=Aerococcus kribbianus TaxID=2999064 RepID=A0A9X3FLR8_9LACT|nr:MULTISPECIES: DNA-directed RNA polymerase subunit epsilon [unclassified Aerococcus]MCZ0716710.1 DNA-directed RNA polymerase subunit epsilon [Aerococcus sp. YH-aer221]MCZ0724998.1 DNA-directed RNA polymerase subunit epsilon [Aerococcus sp. YH-aer222]